MIHREPFCWSEHLERELVPWYRTFAGLNNVMRKSRHVNVGREVGLEVLLREPKCST